MTADVEHWDEERARAMIGKRVLIGVTRVSPCGKLVRQMFGTIASIDRNGVDVELEGAHAGQTMRLPPRLDAFHAAGPGDYLLRETGEILVDPDFVSAWTIDEAASDDLAVSARGLARDARTAERTGAKL